jgi:hypothetical protein
VRQVTVPFFLTTSLGAATVELSAVRVRVKRPLYTAQATEVLLYVLRCRRKIQVLRSRCEFITRLRSEQKIQPSKYAGMACGG